MTGTVNDETGAPLPGATVIVEGTSRGVATDFDGNFSINAEEGEVLIVTYVGYSDYRLTVDSQDNYVIDLSTDNALDEVILIALGLEKKKDDNLSSTSVVQVDQLQKSGESGVLQGLPGKTSGVNITRNSGDPGSGAYIQIRGQNTINGDNSPLIVLDGAIISNSNIGAGTTGVVQQSRLNDINPDDIESISVIKGASAAAIYGDVPYSKADKFPEPAYDNQATVVEASLNLIQAGISKVGEASITAGFGGNRLAGSTWKEAGNTLAARYSLSTGNYSAAISFANQGISARANDLVTLHGTSQENRNLYYQFIIDERQDYLVATDSYLVQLLDGRVTRSLNTPGDNIRLNNYFLSDGTRTLINTDEEGRFSQTSSFPLASYYENQLILAEAKFKTNDEDGARMHLNNVRAELRNQYSSDENGFPDSNATGDTLLEQILEEKYITLVGEIVTFHDLRRTRNFIGVPNKTTGSTGASDFPQRFLYPQSEVDTNSNVPSPLPEFFSTTQLLGVSY